MGKRKKSSRKPQGPKKREPLPTTFACLFCNHEKAVTVKLDKKAGIGSLHCKVCGQSFQSGINYLSAAVDVYADWVDACDHVDKQARASDERRSAGPLPTHRDIDKGHTAEKRSVGRSGGSRARNDRTLHDLDEDFYSD